MYQCKWCKNRFDEPYIKRWTEDYGEHFEQEVCPDCGDDDIEELVSCECCGENFPEDELYWDGYCESCILEAVTYDRFYKWLIDEDKDETDSGSLEDFMFTKVFRLTRSDVPTHSNFELKDALKNYYDVIIASECDLHDTVGAYKTILETAREYIKDTGNLDNYVEWLNANGLKVGG